MSGLLSAWIAEMVLIAYRGAKTGTTANNPIPHLTLPSEYASTFVIFGALAFIPGEGQKVATAFGWGLVLATFLNLWTPGGTVKGAVSTSAASGGQAGGPSVAQPGKGGQPIVNPSTNPKTGPVGPLGLAGP